ncbi:hypothetical protein [Helicobacter heilmannii]|uniref:hypothetical protein n=1 Tax=Helicobacter heilmannii TaxID=35817 RepID=UPI000CF1C6D2|nr:hypothetical protein [Helicobacter heilmannii]
MRSALVLAVWLVLGGGGLLGVQAQEALDTSLIHHHPHKEPHHEPNSYAPTQEHTLERNTPTHNAKIPQHAPHNHKAQSHAAPSISAHAPTPHSPQKQATSHATHKTHSTKPHHTPTSLHPWIYSSVFLTAYFGDGHYKQGYGLLLQKGHVLTSAELAYDKGMYATTFIAQMQDDSAPVLICVARLHIKAIDRNKGLALLNTHAFTNDFCQTRPESFYHARIYTRYAQNLFLDKSTTLGLRMYYPKVGNDNAFKVQSLHEHHAYPLLSKQDSNAYGRPFFNSTGVFVGMAVNPSAIAPRTAVDAFLNELKHREIF